MYSEAWQDQFVDLMLDSPVDGYFVDVGAGYNEKEDGRINSNSLMFEQRGWQGIAIDCDISRMQHRKCIVHSAMIGDGYNNTVLLTDILKQYSAPQIIDYLSLDIEGPELAALQSFIASNYVAKVITVEHNLYTCNTGVADNKMNIFKLLSVNNYVRVVDNAGHRAIPKNLHNGYLYEDWYIHVGYVNFQKATHKLSSL